MDFGGKNVLTFQTLRDTDVYTGPLPPIESTPPPPPSECCTGRHVVLVQRNVLIVLEPSPRQEEDPAEPSYPHSALPVSLLHRPIICMPTQLFHIPLVFIFLAFDIPVVENITIEAAASGLLARL